MKDTMYGCDFQHIEDDYVIQGGFYDTIEGNVCQFKFSQAQMSEKLVRSNNLNEETNLAN